MVGHIRRRKRWLAVVGMVALLVSAVGLFLWWAFTSPPYQPDTPAEQAAYNLEVYDALWARLDADHYDPSFGGMDVQALRREFRPLAEAAGSTAALYVTVLRPMLDRLGPSHLVAEPPPDTKWPVGVSFRMPEPRRGQDPWPFSPAQQGHGMVVAWVDGGAVVQTVRCGSPAERAGIAPGLRVDIESFRGAAPERSRPLNEGVFTVQSETGRVESVALEWPDIAPAPGDGARRLEDGALLIRFDQFTEADVDWVLDQFQDAGDGGVILDLRGNIGGRISQMVRLLSAVLPHGVEIGREIERGEVGMLRTRRTSEAYDGPLAVLIGPLSNSAAEATAAALQHHGRAAIVGDRSAGNLLVSVSRRLPYDGRLLLPVADFRAPGGAIIEGVGVAPDIKAVETLAAIRQDRDLVVEAAQAWLAAQR